MIYPIAALKLFALLSLILVHSLAIFSGAWDNELISDSNNNIIYSLILPAFVNLFQINIFIFATGYLDGLTNSLRKDLNTCTFALYLKKIKKLGIPLVIFGIFYFLIFRNYAGIFSFLFSIINGIGHLWYLTMLIILLFVSLLLDKYITKDNILFIVLFAFYFISPFCPNIFQICNVFIYLPMFYFGRYLATKKMDELKFYPYLHFFFIILFGGYILFELYIKTIGLQQFSFLFFLIKEIRLTFKLILSFLSVYFLFLLFFNSIRYTDHLKLFLDKTNKHFMAVYIIHQFVLLYIIEYTYFLKSVNVCYIPIVLFFLGLSISLALSVILKSNSLINKYI